jgi:hypothetical protein
MQRALDFSPSSTWAPTLGRTAALSPQPAFTYHRHVMMDFKRVFSMPIVVLALLAGSPAAAIRTNAGGSCESDPPDSGSVPIKDHRSVERFPSFCSIPIIPTDVRTADAFKAAVLNSRRAGAALTRDSSAGTFGLKDTSRFEASAQRAAAPPPPMVEPGGLDTDAFIKAARAQASPPSRPR